LGSLVRRHEIAHHGRPSNFVCRICGRQLASTQELTLHEAAHDSVKAFECAHCAHHYKHKESLLTHIRQQHLGMARIYVCAACGYQTTKRSRHETHVVLHQPQPSPCPKCPQVLIHTSETTHAHSLLLYGTFS
jgi:DNA-directed RNA polymerase subunit M/transcription elongation factor TFIIS